MTYLKTLLCLFYQKRKNMHLTIPFPKCVQGISSQLLKTAGANKKRLENLKENLLWGWHPSPLLRSVTCTAPEEYARTLTSTGLTWTEQAIQDRLRHELYCNCTQCTADSVGELNCFSVVIAKLEQLRNICLHTWALIMSKVNKTKQPSHCLVYTT